jgi:hypothetical protein
MRARHAIVLFSAITLASVSAGCALELDYGRPDMDAGLGDSGGGGADAATACDAGCDDGLRCTVDSCSGGVCVHASVCPADTECIARGGGECRRACTTAADCNDGLPCTDDSCDPTDHHCRHTSTCQAGRPQCLSSGACVPRDCSTSADCDDHDACNGVEQCVAGACTAGTPVTCPTAECATFACDPTNGQCDATLQPDLCDDGASCTADSCSPEGACSHTPRNTVCTSADHCLDLRCAPGDAGADPSTGCVGTPVSCPASPCTGGLPAMCDPASGACNYDSFCAGGQVCGAMGCMFPHPCTSDSECTTVLGPDGCATACVASHCQPLVCADVVGECGAVDANAATGCATPMGGMCHWHASDALCDDGNPQTADTCNPSGFTCQHTCHNDPNNCVQYTYVAGTCVPMADDAFCISRHSGTTDPPTRSDCARWQCVGPTTGAGTDGCGVVAFSGVCDDGATCTDDVCQIFDRTSARGQCTNAPSAAAPTICNDGMTCTMDVCAPGSGGADLNGCTHAPNDAMCGTATGCAQPYCSGVPISLMLGARTLPLGCAARYMPSACMPGQVCSPDGACVMARLCTALSLFCDDGNACNGTEMCDGVLGRCVQSPPPSCTTMGCNGVCQPQPLNAYSCVTAAGPTCVFSP